MQSRQHFGWAALNGRLYVVGGIGEGPTIVATVDFRDDDNIWYPAAPLPRPLLQPAVRAAGGRVYSIGGFVDAQGSAVDSVFAYDPQSNQWQARAPLPSPRGAAAAAVIGGLIYVGGGRRANDAVDDFAVYDPALDRWTELPALPTARESLSAAALDGIFYAIGGRADASASAVVEAYDPVASRWRGNLAPMPTARAAMAATVLYDQLFLIGGTAGEEVLGVTEAYSPDTDTWQTYPPVPVPRHGAGASALGSRILFFGGSVQAGIAPVGVNDALILATAISSGCTADCNYDGAVSTVEIEAAIHRLYGTPAAASCETLAIDTDHDRRLSAADMIAAVRSLTDTCRASGRLFEDASEDANLSFFLPRGDPEDFPLGGGIGIADFNNDGHEDAFLVSHDGSNALFLNRGNGGFDEATQAAGVGDPVTKSKGLCVADYDNDGDQDIYVAAYGPNRLFRNDGAGAFVDTAAAAGVDDPTTTGTICAWGDYDSDGFLDLYAGNFFEMGMTRLRQIYVEGLDSDPNTFASGRRLGHLYRNRGDGTFEDVSGLLGPEQLRYGAALAVTFVDYDDDGDVDLHLANDFGPVITPNVLWRNDGPDGSGGWRFTDVSAASGADLAIFSMGIAVGDYDKDLDIDFAITNTGANRLLANRGDGTFEDRTYIEAIDRTFLEGVVAPEGPHFPPFSTTWGTAFLDFDNDADLDLYIVAGHLDAVANSYPYQPSVLFRNTGSGSQEFGAWFRDVSRGSGADNDGIGRGLAVADFDTDGRLEMLITNIEQRALLLRYRLPAGGHWLQLKLVGVRSNKNAIGARVVLTTGEQQQLRVVFSGGTYGSQSSLIQHFGLGSHGVAERIDIRWPSGTTQVLTNIPADQRLEIVEPDA
jgi:N-acetylneuraminic acid mutarotase